MVPLEIRNSGGAKIYETKIKNQEPNRILNDNSHDNKDNSNNNSNNKTNIINVGVTQKLSLLKT